MKTYNKPTVIIAGIGSSFGIDLARQFSSCGYDIVIIGRDLEKLNEAIKTLVQYDVTVYAVNADLSDEQSIIDAFSKLDKLNLSPFGLIYNAVARRTKMPSELTREDIVSDLNINLLGAVSCTSQFLSRLGDNKGFVVFTGGGVALQPSVSSASMSIGKAALRNYALTLAGELNSGNVFVGTVTITKKINSSAEYSSELISKKYVEIISNRQEAEIIL